MLFSVAIPTYKRSHLIGKKTLKFLHDNLYPRTLITLFVADEKEKSDYEKNVDPTLYGQIVVGVRGLMHQRNFISQHYAEGELVMQLDDDVENLKSDKPFTEILRLASSFLKEGGLFGVLPNDDGRRFKDDTTLHLTHILGSFFIASNHRDLIITTDEKEDMERSILYFQKFGRVHRYRGAGVKTSYAKAQSGGMNTEDRRAEMEKGAKYLEAKYPDFCTAYVKKGMWDLRMNWRAKVPDKL